jgi:ABC-2 type transport system permease protein
MTGEDSREMAALEDGDRAAVIVIPEGFERSVGAGEATLEAYYDNSDLIRIGYVTATVQAAVDTYNEQVAGSKDVVGLEASGVETKDVNYIDYLTPGMMGMTIMWVNLGVGFLMVNWRETGVLRRLGVTPLRPGTLIASQAIPFGSISLVQVAIIMAIGHFVFGVDVTGSYLWLAVTVFLGITAMLALGYIIASMMRTATSVNAAVNLIAFPMIFLGKSYFPLATPTVLAPLVNFIPLTHLNEALREVINRGAGPEELWVNWAALLAWAFAGYAVSMRFFRWQ